MQDYEQCIVADFEAGRTPTIASMGGFEALKNASKSLPRSPFLTEVVQVVASDSSTTDATKLIVDALVTCNNGIVLRDCVNVLGECVDPSSDLACALFECYRAKVLDDDLEAIGRAAVLDGGFRLVTADSKRRYGFMETLLRVDYTSSPRLARWFAKIVGVMHSHWPDDTLEEILVACAAIPESADEASFELGMSFLMKGMSSLSPTDAKEAFTRARELFLSAEKSSGERPDAVMYALCLRSLIDFYECRISQPDSISKQLALQVTELKLYQRSESDPRWLRARTAQSVLWQELADKLAALDESLTEVGWYEPAATIENYLMPIYRASRCILRRDNLGGVESLIQPKVVGCIGANASFAHVLKSWLRRNHEHEDASAVSELLTRVESEISKSERYSVISNRAQGGIVTEYLAQTTLTVDIQQRLAKVFKSTLEVWHRNLTAAQTIVLSNCLDSVEDHYDYRNTDDVRQLYNSVVFWLTTFASTRLDLSKGDEPALKYLFKTDDGKKSLESELQRDFFQFVKSGIPGTKVEVTNVGGGRADIFVQLGAEKLVIEVKRDSVDCSFEGLTTAYSSQTFEYQNTSARLGFMLVLDQTDRGGAALHLSDLFKTVQITRSNESEPRSILIVKIPGQRLTPSEQSKIGKAALASLRKDQREKSKRPQ